MRQRLWKIARRLLIVVLLLGILGLIAFSWICYWPLEGDVDVVEDLVPPQVEFILRGDFDEIWGGGWVQDNVLGDPIHPEIEAQLSGQRHRIAAEIERLESQVNDAIPLGLIDFSVKDDVLSGEIVIAGVICEGTRPPLPPSWQEILILKRLPWKSRAGLAAALGNQWIRDMAVPPTQVVFTDEGHDVFKLTFPKTPVRSVRARSGCGRGYVMPPDNEWYVFRTKDVVAISNSKPLIMQVEDRSRRSEDALQSDDGLTLPSAGPGEVVMAADLEPLQQYMHEVRVSGGRAGKMLNRYVNTRTLRRLAGQVDLKHPEILRAQADVDVFLNGLLPEVQELYKLPKVDARSGLTSFVPAEDTFMVATLSIKPMTFFTGVYEDYLTEEERRRLDQTIKDEGEYQNMTEFLGDLTDRLGNTSHLAVGRLSELYDTVEFRDWFAEEADPEPGFAFMTRIREGTSLEEVNEFLKSRVPVLGFGKDFEQKQHLGIRYTRIHLKYKLRDFKLLSPCWLLHQDHFVFCQNEDYFKKIIETIVDPAKSLANDNNFRVTMGRLAGQGHLALFVDLDKFFRAPATTDVGAMPRGFMWDRRNVWVAENRNSREEAMRYRRELEDGFQRTHGRQPREEDRVGIEEQVSEHVNQWRDSYPLFVDEYRDYLEGFQRLRSFGIVLGAEGSDLGADMAVFVKSAGEDEDLSFLGEGDGG